MSERKALRNYINGFGLNMGGVAFIASNIVNFSLTLFTIGIAFVIIGWIFILKNKRAAEKILNRLK